MTMNSRERIISALIHEIPDRVPFDIRFSDSKLSEFKEKTGALNPDDYFELDYRYISVRHTKNFPDLFKYFEGRVPCWTDIKSPEFLAKCWPGADGYFIIDEKNSAMNEWGEYRLYGEERNLNYHKKIYPLQGDQIKLNDIVDYPFPDYFADYRYDGVEDEIAQVHNRNLAAVVFNEMTIFEKAWRIRGLEDMMMDFLSHPDFVEALIHQIADRTGYLAERYARAGVDIIQLGDDIGSQVGMMISPKIWRRFLKPELSSLIQRVKSANPNTLIFYHSDGKFEPVIPDLIEIGVKILNPIQPEAMEIEKLKKDFGNSLSFWGGLGVQTVMPFGNVDDVDAAVKWLIQNMGLGGGFVISPAHVIEPDVPWENIIAYIDAAKKYGKY